VAHFRAQLLDEREHDEPVQDRVHAKW
jgi:hypothetical protein